MALFNILLLTFAALLASADAANAGPVVAAVGAIFGAIGSALSAGGVVGALVKLGITLALNVGMSLLQRALMGEPEKPKEPGVRLDIQIGDDNPIAFPIGKYATAGTRKYVGTYGQIRDTKNAYQVEVIQFSDVPSDMLALWAGGEKVEFGEVNDPLGFPVLRYRRDGRDHMWVRIANGLQTTADPYLLEKFGSDEDRPWKDTMIGRGCAYICVTSRFDREVFSQGYPSFVIEPKSINLFDPRKCEALGGTGSHLWSDPSTWEPSDNPAVQIYNIIKGIHYVDELGNVEWLYGGQNVGAHRLPTSNWVAAMNACDEMIELEDGSTEPRFRSGYEVTCDTEPLTVIQELLKACSGRLVETGGQFKILVGAPGAAVMSITDADMVVTREQDYKPFPTLDSTVNGIEATYPEPAERWADKDAPARYSSDLETEDGGRRLTVSVPFPAAPYGKQVQRLMRAMIEEERRFARHVVVLPPMAFVLEPTDTISWSSEHNGYEEKGFLVVRKDGEPGMNQVVMLQEIDPDDYDWDVDFELPIEINPPTVVIPGPQTIEDWAAEGVILQGDDGSRRPAIKLSWDGDVSDVDFVRFGVRLDGETEPFHTGSTMEVAQGHIVITQGIQRATDYEVQGRFDAISSNRPFEPTSWLKVTTPDVPLVNVPGDLAPETVDYSAVSQDVKAALDARDEVYRRTDDLRDLIERLADLNTTSQVELRTKVDYVIHRNEHGIALAARQYEALVEEDLALASILDDVYAELYGEGGGGGGIADAVSLLEAKVERTEQVFNFTISSFGSDWIRLTTTNSPSSVNDFYNGSPIRFVNGPIAGFETTVADYVGNVREITLAGVPPLLPAVGNTVAIGVRGIVKAESTRLDSLTTTVGGNTSSITQILQSIDGTSFKYMLVGEVNGTTGGIVFTGAADVNGAIKRKFSFSSDLVQFGDFNNYARNGDFDRNGATVDPATATAILDWYITTGPTALDVLAHNGSGVPAGAPEGYVLRVNKATTFEVWNQIDPDATGAAAYGVPVKAGQIWRVKALAATSGSSSSTPYFRLAVREADGTVVYQDILNGVTSYYSIAGNSGDGWIEGAQDFLIENDGRLFLSIENTAGASHNWYITRVELFRRNGTQLIVDGSIETELVNGNAITDTAYGAVATGADDKVGNNTFATIIDYDFAVTLPYNYDAWVVFECNFGMDGSATFDSYSGISWTDGSGAHNVTGNSYGGPSHAIGTTRIAVPVVGTGASVTYRGRAYWKGFTSSVTCVGRDFVMYVLKR